MRHRPLQSIDPMNAVLSTVVPVFGLIAVGFFAGRTHYLSDAAIKGLPEFVFRIAMPVMLFRTIGTSAVPDAPAMSILAMFFSGALLVWVLMAVVTRVVLRRGQGDASGLCMASAFANSVMMGLPIALSHFGPKAAPVVALIALCDTAAMWFAATLHLAAAEGTGDQGLGVMVRSLLWRFATNPIILGCACGLLWRVAGVSMPPLADSMVTMLAQAAIPGALVALGLALNSYGLAGQMSAVSAITVMKMLVMPAAAWLVGTYVLGLPKLEVGVVTTLAAMPVGANAYLFAAAYDRQPAAVSGAIAATTPIALVTVSALLMLIG
jgi:malonate transporter and related proteins